MDAFANDAVVGELPMGTTVVAASVNRGRRLLQQIDDFVEQQSAFDRQARVRLNPSAVTVTTDIYLSYVTAQVMDWGESEREALTSIITSMQNAFANLRIALPDTIYLVKTTGLEEGYAAYTRADNVIVLPANMVASLEGVSGFGDPLHPTKSNKYLREILVHECFHLFSKNNPERRRALYELVGYQSLPHPVCLPNVPWPHADSQATMPQLRITNPDTPHVDVYIDLEVPAQPSADGPALPRHLAPFLLADSHYTRGGLFFDYLQWVFVAIDEDSDGAWRPVLEQGRPLVYPTGSQQPYWAAYLNRIGHNLQGELFHPDEILAQNFVHVVNLPDTQLLARIGAQLTGATYA